MVVVIIGGRIGVGQGAGGIIDIEMKLLFADAGIEFASFIGLDLDGISANVRGWRWEKMGVVW